jgi:hypothetical protein
VKAKKPPKGELPPDWFCENQTDLLDLINDMSEALKEENDDADADPDRV